MGEYKNVPQKINDVVSDNIKKLAQLFPSAVKDGQLDIDALKEELGTFEEVGKEKYEFTWSGKQNAKKIAQQDVFGKTLKFCPEKSKNADTTENIYIEGDNLEALKLLRQNYYNSIKMIYIDPPYNTGNDFVYNDDYSMSQEESDIAEGVVDELGERYTKNQKSSNKFHAKWLNEMYPRLKLAKDLLTDDGVIFISIDDNEQENLKKICDEIFGSDNFIATVIDAGTPKNNSRFFSIQHEYVFIYAKHICSLPINWSVYKNNITEYEKRAKVISNSSFSSDEKHKELLQLVKYPRFYDFDHYTYVDEKGIFRLVDISAPGGNGVEYEIIHPLTKKPCKQSSRGWAYTKESMQEKIDNGLIYFGNTEDQVPQQKYYLHENRSQIPRSVVYFDPQKTTKWLKKIGIPFDYVKPLDFIKWIISSYPKKDFFALDFFSGSATTAHAVMQLNAEDGGNRKFIMVQLEEKTDEKSEAHKAGYNTICEIGEERIRRAGDKIAEECQAKIDEYKSKLEVLANNPNGKGIPVEEDEPYPIPDIGFKVFEIADTNIKWNELELKDEQIDFANLSNNPDQVDFKQGTKDIDVVYEIMLRQKNIPLSSKIEVLDEIGSRTYLYADSYLICLETQVTNDMIDKLASIDPTPFKYIFRDSAFKDDIDLKTNAFRRLKAMVEKHAGATKKAYTVEFI